MQRKNRNDIWRAKLPWLAKLTIFSYLTIREKLQVSLTSRDVRDRIFDSFIAREDNTQVLTLKYSENFEKNAIDEYRKRIKPIVALANYLEIVMSSKRNEIAFKIDCY